MASMAMIAIEATIVSTAMPQIAAELGDLQLYSWVFSSFLLAQTATTVIFGKLADTFGRKPVLLAGIAIFLLGSVLCGVAWSMPSLIAFRLLQGIGAGAIQPVALTVIGDLYTIEERGKIQGYLASVWGVSSVAGPFAGGLIIKDLSWSWIFWINLPIGLGAALMFIRFLKEQSVQRERSLDFAGAALFTMAVAALMVGLTELGTSAGSTVLVAFGLSIAAGAAFFWRETRARDPMMDLNLWARRSLLTVNAATLFSGMSMIGLTTFLPMFVQGVLGRSPLVAGLTLTAMVLGWPIASTIGAKNFARFGLKRVMLLGSILIPVGASVFLTLSPESSPLLAAFGSIILGFGMGFLSTSAIVIVQSSVGWTERGAATASNIFSRNLGSTLGAAALGAVFNLGLAFSDGGAMDYDRISMLLEGAGTITSDLAAQGALYVSLHYTFWGVFLVAVTTFLLTLLVPRVPHGSGSQPAVPADRGAEKAFAPGE